MSLSDFLRELMNGFLEAFATAGAFAHQEGVHNTPAVSRVEDSEPTLLCDCILFSIQCSRMLTITIDRDQDDPVYRQVADQVRHFVASGQLQPGTVVPPVRRLAGDLGVNLNTIARAYRLLESEGFLVIRDRAGVTVAAPAEAAQLETRGRLIEELRSMLARLRQAGMASDEATRLMLGEFLALDGKGMEDPND